MILARISQNASRYGLERPRPLRGKLSSNSIGASERTDWHGDGFPATGSQAWGFCDNARPRNDDKQGEGIHED
jgi:hypothetical protein